MVFWNEAGNLLKLLWNTTSLQMLSAASKVLQFNSLTLLTLYLPDQICKFSLQSTIQFFNVSSENLVLDQLIIPKLIFFFILITCLLDIVSYCKEKFSLGHLWELLG